jgi:hypothetical protein
MLARTDMAEAKLNEAMRVEGSASIQHAASQKAYLGRTKFYRPLTRGGRSWPRLLLRLLGQCLELGDVDTAQLVEIVPPGLDRLKYGMVYQEIDHDALALFAQEHEQLRPWIRLERLDAMVGKGYKETGNGIFGRSRLGPRGNPSLEAIA